MKEILIFIIVLFGYIVVSAQVNDNLDYFPHKTGDMWEYFYYDGPMYVDTAQVFTVFDSTDSDGNIFVTQTSRYINPIQIPAVPFTDTMRYKIDTLNQVWGRVGELDSVIAFKLNAKQGDQWILKTSQFNDSTAQYEMAHVRKIYERNIFGVVYTVMNTYYYLTNDPADTTINGLIIYEEELTKGLGRCWLGGGDSPGEMNLRGAVIDSVLYGDTTDVVTSVQNYSSIFPSTFKLEQNYPNPFNPGTNIKFIINVSSTLSLIIYNIEGKEIRRIIDHRFYNPGRYSVYWAGITQNGNKAPSGVYFYSLFINGQLLKTKSMVLLK